jgi:dephospho-CoA kinase
MLAVGITGAPSSGKSSVLRLLRRLGARVVDCDRIVHARLKAGTPEHRRIAARWGGAVLTGGRLDRRKLRAAVPGSRVRSRSSSGRSTRPCAARSRGGSARRGAPGA